MHYHATSMENLSSLAFKINNNIKELEEADVFFIKYEKIFNF
jgi:hypothetical protein